MNFSTIISEANLEKLNSGKYIKDSHHTTIIDNEFLMETVKKDGFVYIYFNSDNLAQGWDKIVNINSNENKYIHPNEVFSKPTELSAVELAKKLLEVLSEQ